MIMKEFNSVIATELECYVWHVYLPVYVTTTKKNQKQVLTELQLY